MVENTTRIIRLERKVKKLESLVHKLIDEKKENDKLWEYSIEGDEEE